MVGYADEEVMLTTVAAIVPLRHHSARVPGKNYRLFGGKPLYHHIIIKLLDSSMVSEVIIDTDSPTILEDAKQNFPAVKLLNRPPHLCDDETPMNDVLLNVVSQIPATHYFQTHSTNPLLKIETIDSAIQTYLDNFPVYDSLFGVTRLQQRLWDSLSRAVNHNPRILLRTQDLPPLYTENSCLYLFDSNVLVNKHNRIGDRPMMFDIDRNEAWDIDEELDFRVAEFLYNENTHEL